MDIENNSSSGSVAMVYKSVMMGLGLLVESREVARIQYRDISSDTLGKSKQLWRLVADKMVEQAVSIEIMKNNLELKIKNHFLDKQQNRKKSSTSRLSEQRTFELPISIQTNNFLQENKKRPLISQFNTRVPDPRPARER